MKVCGNCGMSFNGPQMIQKCPHPIVNKELGEYICYCCCKKCKHNDVKVLGVRCIYPNSNRGANNDQ